MKITQAFTFEAAHRLERFPKTHRCYNVHGHSYRVELTFVGIVDQKTGVIMDFFDIEATFSPILKMLDHHYLNDVPGLDNPTVENISRWVWNNVVDCYHYNAVLISAKVYETPNCWAECNGTES